MTFILVFAAGAGYAAGLWRIAAHIARRRTIALGTLPYWLPAVCGAGSVAVERYCSPDVAVLAAASLVGAIVCAVVDARTGFIFDALSLSMIVVASLLGVATGHFLDGALAAIIVGGTLTALYVASGRRGIGLGDVKLGTALALGYGLPASVLAIGSAFIIGAAYAGVLIGLGRARRSDAVRFGPFIAGGAAVGLTATVCGFQW